MAYQITVNENQLRTLSKALELYSRIGIGQIESVVYELASHYPHLFSVSDEDMALALKWRMGHTKTSSWGIHNEKVAQPFKESCTLAMLFSGVLQKKVPHDCNLSFEPQAKIMQVAD